MQRLEAWERCPDADSCELYLVCCRCRPAWVQCMGSALTTSGSLLQDVCSAGEPLQQPANAMLLSPQGLPSQTAPQLHRYRNGHTRGLLPLSVAGPIELGEQRSSQPGV